MALKVELKPGERIIVGTSVITNGDTRIRFFIEGGAPILREKDILTASLADTPAKTVYLALQVMYLSGDVGRHHADYFGVVNEFLKAAPSALPLVAEINNHILNDETYKALRVARRLIAYEAELVAHATGGERLRQDGPGRSIASPARGDDPRPRGGAAAKGAG